MRQTPLTSPGFRTYEIDISDKSSVYSNESPKGSSTPSQSGQENTGGNPIVQNFILLENGFYLLQEDNNKILI